MPRTHSPPGALRGCSRTGTLLGSRLPSPFPARPQRDPRRDTREITVSSSGACAEGAVQEGFRTVALGFVSANDFYKRSPFEEAVILSGARFFFSLPSDAREFL